VKVRFLAIAIVCLSSTGCGGVAVPLVRSYVNAVLAIVLIAVWLLIVSIPFWVGLAVGFAVRSKRHSVWIVVASLIAGALYLWRFPWGDVKESAEFEYLDPNNAEFADEHEGLMIVPVTTWVRADAFDSFIYYQPKLIYLTDRLFVKHALARPPSSLLGLIVMILCLPAFIVRLVLYYLLGYLISVIAIIWPPPVTLALGVGAGMNRQ
jgi:hypothetical protein